MTVAFVLLVTVGVVLVLTALASTRSPSGATRRVDGSGVAVLPIRWRSTRPSVWSLSRGTVLAALCAGGGLLIGGALSVVADVPPVLALVTVTILGTGGALLPRAMADRRARLRLAAADRQVADLAGLLSVELRSGIGVDAAIENVADELEGDLAEEVQVLATEVRLGLSRQEALARLRVRLPAPNVERFCQALQHAEQLGSPVAQTLDLLAEDCATRHFQHVREEAARLPVKILFPMILCIFPPMLVVLAGPAMVDILHSL